MQKLRLSPISFSNENNQDSKPRYNWEAKFLTKTQFSLNNDLTKSQTPEADYLNSFWQHLSWILTCQNYAITIQISWNDLQPRMILFKKTYHLTLARCFIILETTDMKSVSSRKQVPAPRVTRGRCHSYHSLRWTTAAALFLLLTGNGLITEKSHVLLHCKCADRQVSRKCFQRAKHSPEQSNRKFFKGSREVSKFTDPVVMPKR